MGVSDSQHRSGLRMEVCEDASRASARVAQLIATQIRERPDCVLGLATGGTPVEAYRELIEMNARGDVDFSRVTTFNLDEYVGLDGTHPQSYRAFMNEQLFDHVNIDKARTHVPDGCAAKVDVHCDHYESMIRSAGGIDLQLLGLGHNGHIAFNEPGSPWESRTRQVDLTAETIEKNARFFDTIEQVPRHAITMGIATVMEAKKIVLLALGEGKAEAVSRMVDGTVSEDFPATVLRQHPDATIVLDRAAAGMLRPAEG